MALTAIVRRLAGAGALLLPGAASAQAAPPAATALSADPCAVLAAATAGKPQAEAAAIAQRDDWAGLCRYAADDAARSAPARLVMIGDSLTEGWQKAQPDLFAGAIVGRGISGQTTPQMLVRFEQDVIALRPREVHILAGTNDIAGNTGPTSVQRIERNIEAMATLARAHRIDVVLGSLLPAERFWWRPDYRPPAAIAAFNRWLRDYAARNGFGYIDYYAAMATPGGGMRAAYSDDGVHPNAAGYATMRPLLERRIAGR